MNIMGSLKGTSQQPGNLQLSPYLPHHEELQNLGAEAKATVQAWNDFRNIIQKINLSNVTIKEVEEIKSHMNAFFESIKASTLHYQTSSATDASIDSFAKEISQAVFEIGQVSDTFASWDEFSRDFYSIFQISPNYDGITLAFVESVKKACRNERTPLHSKHSTMIGGLVVVQSQVQTEAQTALKLVSVDSSSSPVSDNSAINNYEQILGGLHKKTQDHTSGLRRLIENDVVDVDPISTSSIIPGIVPRNDSFRPSTSTMRGPSPEPITPALPKLAGNLAPLTTKGPNTLPIGTAPTEPKFNKEVLEKMNDENHDADMGQGFIQALKSNNAFERFKIEFALKLERSKDNVYFVYKLTDKEKQDYMTLRAKFSSIRCLAEETGWTFEAVGLNADHSALVASMKIATKRTSDPFRTLTSVSDSYKHPSTGKRLKNSSEILSDVLKQLTESSQYQKNDGETIPQTITPPEGTENGFIEEKVPEPSVNPKKIQPPMPEVCKSNVSKLSDWFKNSPKLKKTINGVLLAGTVVAAALFGFSATKKAVVTEAKNSAPTASSMVQAPATHNTNPQKPAPIVKAPESTKKSYKFDTSHPEFGHYTERFVKSGPAFLSKVLNGTLETARFENNDSLSGEKLKIALAKELIKKGLETDIPLNKVQGEVLKAYLNGTLLRNLEIYEKNLSSDRNEKWGDGGAEAKRFYNALFIEETNSQLKVSYILDLDSKTNGGLGQLRSIKKIAIGRLLNEAVDQVAAEELNTRSPYEIAKKICERAKKIVEDASSGSDLKLAETARKNICDAAANKVPNLITNAANARKKVEEKTIEKPNGTTGFNQFNQQDQNWFNEGEKMTQDNQKEAAQIQNLINKNPGWFTLEPNKNPPKSMFASLKERAKNFFGIKPETAEEKERKELAKLIPKKSFLRNIFDV